MRLPVLDDQAHLYFDIPNTAANPHHMTFVVKVHEHRRNELGAVTHVDGTARVQLVTRRHCPSFWRLISAFHEETGCPILLNTSFNNSFEPIVQYVGDAIRTFITTELDSLVINDQIITKRKRVIDILPDLCVYKFVFFPSPHGVSWAF